MKISRMSYTCVCLAICILISAGIGTLAYAGKWVPIGGPATGVFVGGNGLYARLQSGDIYRYEGSPNNWTKVGGPGATFAINKAGLYGLSLDQKSVWQYTGTGNKWSMIASAPPGQDRIGYIWARGKDLYMATPTPGESFTYAAIWQYQP